MTGMPEFTRGPWVISGKHPWVVECETNIPPHKGTVVKVSYRPDAYLIAAAPDLYEALEAAVQLAFIATDWNLDEVEIDSDMVSTYDLIDLFQKALAKARGTS